MVPQGCHEPSRGGRDCRPAVAARTPSVICSAGTDPHAFRQRGSELARCGIAGDRRDASPAEVMVWMPAIGGVVLHDPTDTDIAEAWGIRTSLAAADATSTCW